MLIGTIFKSNLSFNNSTEFNLLVIRMVGCFPFFSKACCGWIFYLCKVHPNFTKCRAWGQTHTHTDAQTQRHTKPPCSLDQAHKLQKPRSSKKSTNRFNMQHLKPSNITDIYFTHKSSIRILFQKFSISNLQVFSGIPFYVLLHTVNNSCSANDLTRERTEEKQHFMKYWYTLGNLTIISRAPW